MYQKYKKVQGPWHDGSFGVFQKMSGKGYSYCEAPIYLLYGEQRPGGRGSFGLYHIWQQRQLNHQMTIDDAAIHISARLQHVFSRAKVHCEFEHPGGNHRANAYAYTSKEAVILQYMTKYEYYSVVTWYQLWGKEKGHHIGDLQISY